MKVEQVEAKTTKEGKHEVRIRFDEINSGISVNVFSFEKKNPQVHISPFSGGSSKGSFFKENVVMSEKELDVVREDIVKAMKPAMDTIDKKVKAVMKKHKFSER